MSHVVRHGPHNARVVGKNRICVLRYNKILNLLFLFICFTEILVKSDILIEG